MSIPQQELSTICKATLGELQVSISSAPFNTMIAPLQLIEIKDGIAILSCNNSFIQSQVEAKYYNLIKQILEKHTQQTLSLVFNLQTTDKQTINDLPLFTPPQKQTFPIAPDQLNSALLKSNLF